MSLRIRWLTILIFAAALPVMLRGAEAVDDDKRYVTVKLVDPASAPQAEREATLAYFKRKAIDGNLYAQYIVGSLYRIGDKLPGNLVELDLPEAGKYLSTAAAHGQIRSMAKMSEIELVQNHYVEAMIWAQLFAYYSGLTGADAQTIKNSPESDYLADLLTRIYARFDKAQMPTVMDDVKAFVAAHDADIKKGREAPLVWGTPDGNMRPRSSSTRHMVAPPHPSGTEFKDVMADYLIAFDAKGDASDAWLIDALPDVTLGNALRIVALGVEVNPAQSDAAQPRYALQPINFSWRQTTLRATKK